MWLIGFFQLADFLRGQLDRDGCGSIIQVMGLGRADDRCGNVRLGEHPGYSDLGHRQATSFGHIADALRDLQVLISI